MIKALLARFRKAPVAAPLVVSQRPPAEDLDDLLNAAVEEWKRRYPQLHHSDVLECWIDRKDTMEGMIWVCRLQAQQPLYDVNFRKIPGRR